MWALICSDHKEEVDLFANEELDVEDEDEMDVSPTFSMENSDEQLPGWVEIFMQTFFQVKCSIR